MGFLDSDSASFTLPADFDLRRVPVVDVSDEPPTTPSLGTPGSRSSAAPSSLMSCAGRGIAPLGDERVATFTKHRRARLRLLRDRGSRAALAGRGRTGRRPDRRACSTSATTTSSWSGSTPSPEPERRRGLRPGPRRHPCRRRRGLRPAAGRLDRGRLHRTAADVDGPRTDRGAVLRRATDAAVRPAGPRPRPPERDRRWAGSSGSPTGWRPASSTTGARPARIHGDLWSGNVIFTRRAWC